MKKIAKILVIICAIAFAVPKTYAQVSVGVGISAAIAPPALPVYEQPACPVEGYIWQPGYWAYSDDGGYYWVPGVWVAPPDPGYLWTPPYWGFAAGVYGFHPGYWGLHVGFYGGINYGFGYGGEGFYGGRWAGNRFMYNAAVWHVNRAFIHNTYIDRTVIRNNTRNHYSFNGPGGANARPTRFEEAAMRERHIHATANQIAHQRAARANRAQFANINHGRPAAVAMNRVHGRAYNDRGHIARAAMQHQHAVEHMQAQRQRATENRVAQRQRTNGNMRAERQRATVQRQNMQAQRAQMQQHRMQQQQRVQQQRAQLQQRPAQQRPNRQRAGVR